MSFRILQIGAGIRGAHWAQFVEEYPDATCVALCDPDAGAHAKIRGLLGDEGFPCFTDLSDALAQVEADAALIVSPSAFHAEQTIRCLEAGLAVMVEKPCAVSVAEAQEVLRRAEDLDRPVIVAENYRFWPAERTVRRLLRENRLGRVDHAVLIDRRHMPSHTEGPWFASLDYPQLQEIAIHHFDSLRSFFDQPPTGIRARTWNPPWSDYKRGANTEALIEFGELQVQYLGTLLSHRFAFSLRIEGERGELWTNRKVVAWRPKGSRWFRPIKNVTVPPGDAAKYPKGGTTSLLNSLRDAAIHGRAAETRIQDNIWTLAMVEAGKTSDREGRRVAIETPWAETD